MGLAGLRSMRAFNGSALDLSLHLLHLLLEVDHSVEAALQELHVEHLFGVEGGRAVGAVFLQLALRGLQSASHLVVLLRKIVFLGGL